MAELWVVERKDGSIHDYGEDRAALYECYEFEICDGRYTLVRYTRTPEADHG